MFDTTASDVEHILGRTNSLLQALSDMSGSWDVVPDEICPESIVKVEPQLQSGDSDEPMRHVRNNDVSSQASNKDTMRKVSAFSCESKPATFLAPIFKVPSHRDQLAATRPAREELEHNAHGVYTRVALIQHNELTKLSPRLCETPLCDERPMSAIVELS